MADWDRLRDEVLVLLREQVKDLWDEEDAVFLQTLAVDISREKYKATITTQPQVHEQNLRHLAATLQGEVARRQLRLNRAGQDLFVRVLESVIKTVAIPALVAAIR